MREVLDDISSAIHETVNMTQQGMLCIETGLVEVRATGDSLRRLSGNGPASAPMRNRGPRDSGPAGRH